MAALPDQTVLGFELTEPTTMGELRTLMNLWAMMGMADDEVIWSPKDDRHALLTSEWRRQDIKRAADAKKSLNR